MFSKSEFVGRAQHEVHILVHLASKVDPAMLEYRPSAEQRSLMELLQYLTVFVPIHLRTISAGRWDLETWRNDWRKEETAAKARTLEEIRMEIGKQRELFEELVEPLSEDDLRAEMEMFGSKESRGSWLVWMVLCHYAAYRMQLFLYLKACGLGDLSTMNLWAGIDATKRKDN